MKGSSDWASLYFLSVSLLKVSIWPPNFDFARFFLAFALKVSIWPVGFLQFWIVSDAYITLPKFFFLFWPDFPVNTRFKFPAGATPFKIGRLIKSKRVLGLAGRDVISGKKNFYNSLKKSRFLFRKDVIFLWVNTITRNNCITDLHESLTTFVLSWNDVTRHQTPRSRPTLKGVAPAGNLSHILTGKWVRTGKRFWEGYLCVRNYWKLQKPYRPYRHFKFYFYRSQRRLSKTNSSLLLN